MNWIRGGSEPPDQSPDLIPQIEDGDFFVISDVDHLAQRLLRFQSPHGAFDRILDVGKASCLSPSPWMVMGLFFRAQSIKMDWGPPHQVRFCLGP